MTKNERSRAGETPINIVEAEFPKDPKERFGALLAAVNIGPKATTLLLLPPKGSYVAPNTLGRQLMDTLAGIPEADFLRTTTAPQYCYQSFVNIGLVASAYTIPTMGGEILVGYSRTKAGDEYGIPAASLAHTFEYKHKDINLFNVLGAISLNTPDGHRAPLTRALVLMYLAKQTSPVTEADMVKEFGLSSTTLANSLGALMRAGVVYYEAITPQTGKIQVTYTRGNLSITEITTIKGMTKLPPMIATICEKLAQNNIPITQKAVRAELPETVTKRWQYDYLQRMINVFLSELSTLGFLTRGPFKGTERASLAYITEKGKAVVQDFLSPMWNLVNDSEKTYRMLKEEVVPQVMTHLGAYVKNAAESYYPFSKSLRMNMMNQAVDLVRTLLANNPQGLPISDLVKLTGLSRFTLVTYLQKNLGNEVEHDTKNEASYYFLKPSPKT